MSLPDRAKSPLSKPDEAAADEQAEEAALARDFNCQDLDNGNGNCHCPGPGRETLEGSFSSVSTPNFTSKYSFFRILVSTHVALTLAAALVHAVG